MIRISDARMSGHCLRHRVRTRRPGGSRRAASACAGDLIEIDVAKRRIPPCLRRRTRQTESGTALPHSDRGWVKLCCETVLQDHGVDLEHLVGSQAKVDGKATGMRK
jgi:hypothetical protein